MGDAVCVANSCRAASSQDVEEDGEDGDPDASDTSDTEDVQQPDTVEPPPDAEVDGHDDTSDDIDTHADADASDPDADTWPEALELVTTLPADEARDIGLGVGIELRFNQPLDRTTVTPSMFRVEVLGQGTIPHRVTLDPEDPSIVRLNPSDTDDWLVTLTTYRVVVMANLRGIAGARMESNATFTFQTRPPRGEAFREALARHYAPVVYLEVENEVIDTFTRVDFDGDLDASNNLRNSQRAQEAWTYYHVVETATHFFVHYLFYFPGQLPGTLTGDPYEHAWLGVMVIAQRQAESSFGQLRAFATMWEGSKDVAWVGPAAFYQAQQTSAVSHAAGTPSEPNTMVRMTWGDNSLEDGRRPVLFVPARHHALCAMRSISQTDYTCTITAGPTSPFRSDSRVFRRVFRAGETADQPLPGTSSGEHSYRLISFASLVWPNRHLRAPGQLFETLEEFVPAGNDPDGLSMDNTTFVPTRLQESANARVFRASGQTPFAFTGRASRREGADLRAVWLLDPSWYARRAFVFPENFARRYCFNFFLSIDERGRLTFCTQAEPELP